MTKIGLGVITYNRKPYLKQCLLALQECNWGGASEVVVVDDGSTDGTQEYLDEWDFISIKKATNKGVGHSKNRALAALIELGCDELFLIEDDIIMKDPKTCIKYIAYARQKKIEHMNFGLHGPLNRDKGFINNNMVWCYPDCVGAFSYYTKNVIDQVGYYDEKFVNAWEHVEHTYRICKAGLTTPFWQFADHPDSLCMLEEIEGSIVNSSIRQDERWRKQMEEGQKYFIQKYGPVPRPKQ